MKKYWDDAARGRRKGFENGHVTQYVDLPGNICYCGEHQDGAMDKGERRQCATARKELGRELMFF